MLRWSQLKHPSAWSISFCALRVLYTRLRLTWDAYTSYRKSKFRLPVLKNAYPDVVIFANLLTHPDVWSSSEGCHLSYWLFIHTSGSCTTPASYTIPFNGNSSSPSLSGSPPRKPYSLVAYSRILDIGITLESWVYVIRCASRPITLVPPVHTATRHPRYISNPGK